MLMDQKSDSWSFSRNYRCFSQSRKISVGILADYASNAEGNDVKEAKIALDGNTEKGTCVKHHEENLLLVGQRLTIVHKEASPQSLRSCFNLKILPYQGAYKKEHSPSFQVISKKCAKEKASEDHYITPFAGMTGSESDPLRRRCSEKVTDSGNSRKSKIGRHVENAVCSTKPTLKEYGEDKGRQKGTKGHETLRMKLLEILGDVSSPSKLHPSHQSVDLHLDQERDERQSPTRKVNLNSDTIESDSEKQTSKGPETRCLTQKKVTAKHGHSKIAVQKSTCFRKDSAQNRVFSLKGDWYGGLHDKFKNSSLPSKRNMIIREISRVDMLESSKHERAQKTHQSESKRRSMSANEKFVVHKDKVLVPNSSNDRRCKIFPKVKAGVKKNNSFNSPDDVMNKLQKDAGQQMDAEICKSKDQQDNIASSLLKKTSAGMDDGLVETEVTINKIRSSDNRPPDMITSQHKDDGQPSDADLSNLKDMQTGISDSLSKKRRSSTISNSLSKKRRSSNISNSLSKKRNPAISDSLSEKRDRADDPSSPPYGINLPGCSTQGNLQADSPAEKIFSSNDIQSFKRLSSSKPTEPKLKKLEESSMKDGKDKVNYSLLKKPSFVVEVDSENHVSASSTDAVGSDSPPDDSPVKGCMGSVQLSPKDCSSENFLHDSYRNPANEKDNTVDRCTPVAEMLDEIQETNLKMCVDQDVNDGLASAVALLTVALARLKTKLNSMTRRRSAEILVASANEMHSLLQNAESQVKTDMGKLINISHSKRKLLETKFQEKLEHLLGTYRRFKEEVYQQLQDYGSVIEDLGEHEVELKRVLQRQRAAHKKFLSQLEQDIRGQVQDAESRIMSVQELAREKMLQLKLVVAESVKYIASS